MMHKCVCLPSDGSGGLLLQLVEPLEVVGTVELFLPYAQEYATKSLHLCFCPLAWDTSSFVRASLQVQEAKLLLSSSDAFVKTSSASKGGAPAAVAAEKRDFAEGDSDVMHDGDVEDVGLETGQGLTCE
eukprot:8277745-Alexandrium_andersonii.AAC.1